ncbi:hypothetical protein [Gracilinema caldarium]|uniref:Thioredoxin-like protein n=1 Tax=Gracilinema caldarium (strain ATCC 51460 / DSM 7334 / H1) TaxID=744872 RepID=F8F0Z8_GRAC1|nr:hypothetical protein [Gracilinema caldarium]AEJ20284.1 hypothetical protein Spica_2161 [Gracilinema caldarium DSM 7334]
MIRKITEAEARYAMAHGEFAPELRNSAPAVAIILTQSWCPQWRFMKAYLPQVDASLNADEKAGQTHIYYLEYDLEDWYEEFLPFKENTFQNWDVPYVRYYHQGRLTGESNFIADKGFIAALQRS